ncbi:hypothetical protein B0T10DRAFT_297584 [Thelonectria olida]|uniref:Uncharacterized protein n=1 Tax=Thelonectria olida TaxID=1576542 RepID=A0A9P8VR18_9HYPO|nr:hypothetical protein B0T10DRAFT_297584 [Thelonectria olida]
MSMSIFNLPYPPLLLYHDYPSLQGKLMPRNNEFLRLKGRNLQIYSHALVEIATRNRSDQFNTHSCVMIDPIKLNQIELSNKFVSKRRAPLAQANLSDDEMILLSPLMYGFGLGDKIWSKCYYVSNYYLYGLLFLYLLINMYFNSFLQLLDFEMWLEMRL